MSLHHPSSTKRIQLFFAVEGLPARDELLLKSMIRLLNFKTKHDWQYNPALANILIVKQFNDHGEPDQRKHMSNRSCKTLSINTLRFDAPIIGVTGYRDTWQLNVVKVEDVLNRMGDECCQQLQVLQSRPTSATKQADSDDSFRLTRWPVASMLKDMPRKRLAAVMVGLPLTLADIVEKSGVDAQGCAEFIMELKQAGLLAITKSASRQATSTALFASPEPAALHAPYATATKPASIFSRIRNRLSSIVVKSSNRHDRDHYA